MKYATSRSMVRVAMAGVVTLAAFAAAPATADDAAKTAPPSSGAALVGGALPGGAILSARYVQLTPAAGGEPMIETISGDGVFRFSGLKPGTYQMSFLSEAAAARMFTNVSVPKQTQGTTFGEKVNSGLQQTGNAVASGAAKSQQAGPATASTARPDSASGARTIDSTPARISTNFTVGKQNGRLDVDGPGTSIEVGADGTLAGRLTPAQ